MYIYITLAELPRYIVLYIYIYIYVYILYICIYICIYIYVYICISRVAPLCLRGKEVAHNNIVWKLRSFHLFENRFIYAIRKASYVDMCSPTQREIKINNTEPRITVNNSKCVWFGTDKTQFRHKSAVQQHCKKYERTHHRHDLTKCDKKSHWNEHIITNTSPSNETTSNGGNGGDKQRTENSEIWHMKDNQKDSMRGNDRGTKEFGEYQKHVTRQTQPDYGRWKQLKEIWRMGQQQATTI